MGNRSYEGLINIENNILTLSQEMDNIIKNNCKTKADLVNIKDSIHRRYGGSGRRLDKIGENVIIDTIFREIDTICGQERVSLISKTKAFVGTPIGSDKSKIIKPEQSTKEEPIQAGGNNFLQRIVAKTTAGTKFQTAFNPMRGRNDI